MPKILKYILFALLAVSLFFAGSKLFLPEKTELNIDKNKINLYLFYGQGCPHCAKEEKFLDALKKTEPSIDYHKFETWYNPENAKLLDNLRRDLEIDGTGVPVLIVGTDTIVGFASEETTGKDIVKLIEKYKKEACEDKVLPYLETSKEFDCGHKCAISGEECTHDCGCSDDRVKNSQAEASKKLPESFQFPFLGEVKIKNLSLGLFTILVGTADGFNPCAMWVLLFLINLLLSMKDKKKMWILGGTFILTSALVYYLFVFTWLKLLLSVGLIIWVRLFIGAVAIGSGVYHLEEYWKNRDGTCEVIDKEKRQTMSARVKDAALKNSFLLSVLSIIILAVSVNWVELLCSAGFPQIFAQVMSLAGLSAWQYQLYLFLYVLVFMLDDILIFSIAMATLQLKGLSSKYTRWSGLVGGVLMLLIGLLLILKPEWIMFG